MTLRLFAVLALGVSLLPAQKFPSAIATDADVYKAVNRAEAQLSSGVDSSTLVLPLNTTAGFVVSALVTVENERMRICAVGGSSITVCARGFAGSSAATHASGRAVRAQITAEFHNALADELKAVEQALGANMQNVHPFQSDLYDFTAQQPGGSLVVGLNPITLTPVPRGVNGTDTHHYLYVSGGTGTAESCLITGGTAVSEAASGQIIITCANTHSGAWTIRSATAGIQEAANMVPTAGGTVLVPAGIWTTRAPVYVEKDHFVLTGAGRNAATIRNLEATGSIIVFNGSAVHSGNMVRDLGFSGESAKTSGYAIECMNQYQFDVQNVHIGYVPSGVRVGGTIDGYSYQVSLRRVTVLGAYNSGIGINIEAGGDHFIENVTTGGDGTSVGFKVVATGGLVMSNSGTLFNKIGLLIEPTNTSATWLWFNNVCFDTSVEDGIRINPIGSSASIRQVFFNQVWASNNTFNGMKIMQTGTPAAYDGVNITQGRFNGNQLNGIVVDPSAVTFKNLDVSATTSSDNGQAADATYYGINVNAAVSSLSLVNNNFGTIGFSEITGHRQAGGIFYLGGATNQAIITGNRGLNYVLAPIIITNFPGTSGAWIVKDNAGMVNAVLASAATVHLGIAPFPWYNVTGNTPISTIDNTWVSREITLQFDHASPGGLVGGGNIRTPKTVVQNQVVRCYYDGFGYWNCQ